jgi:hypothetical protein
LIFDAGFRYTELAGQPSGRRHVHQRIGTYYQDKVVDYEALNVACDAPRWLKMLHKDGYITTPDVT